MSRKIMFRWLLTIAFLLVVTLIWGAVSTLRVLADCGTPPRSSCISCHAPDGHVNGMGEWNSVHLNQDMCTNCHGGNANTMDKDLAHEGVVVQPLSDIYTDCHSCHPTDYKARSNQLAAILNVTPDSCATPTAVAIYGGSGGSQTGGATLSLSTAGGIPTWKSFILITGMLASLAFFLLELNWLNNHRVKS